MHHTDRVTTHAEPLDSELWLVRHGETEWSRARRHTSTTDLPLTDEGRRVAETLRERLATQAFDAVFTSPRARARETAVLAGFPGAVVREELVEWNYGDYEGITTSEIRQSVPDWTVWSHPTPGGESAADVTARLDAFLASLAPGRTLVFGHAHGLRALTARWLALPVSEGRLFRLDTATVSTLGYEREQPVILSWNS
ncbi:MAG: histidine phosphatase family protein [Nocardioides sp.]